MCFTGVFGMKKRFYESFLLKTCFKIKKECNSNIEAAKKYLNKYLNDLKLHLDLSDIDMQKVLMETYCANKPQNPFIKYLSMLKYWN